jgi:hypothetical protein
LGYFYSSLTSIWSCFFKLITTSVFSHGAFGKVTGAATRLPSNVFGWCTAVELWRLRWYITLTFP